MPDSEAMTIDERRKCIKRMRASYVAADRAERGRLLCHLEELTDLDRKTLIRLLRSADLTRQPRTRQRERSYGSAVDDALRVIWESLDYVCAERLRPALAPTARLLAWGARKGGRARSGLAEERIGAHPLQDTGDRRLPPFVEQVGA